MGSHVRVVCSLRRRGAIRQCRAAWSQKAETRVGVGRHRITFGVPRPAVSSHLHAGLSRAFRPSGLPFTWRPVEDWREVRRAE